MPSTFRLCGCSSQQDSVKSEMGSILNQSAVLVNVVIAVLASYGIGYYIGSYFTKRNNEVRFVHFECAVIYAPVCDLTLSFDGCTLSKSA